MLPALNLRAPGLLCGLYYRCLAGGADAAEAALTRRRLENSKAEATELALALSRVRADFKIAQDKAAVATRELEEAAVDVQLFNEQYPPPPRRRSLLGSRPGREDPETAARRGELDRLLELAREAAGRTGNNAESLAKQEGELSRQLDKCGNEQATLSTRLRSQYAAAVLEQCAAGNWAEADSRIVELRQALRGDLAVAVLGVLASQLRDGAAAGRQEVLEASGLFENHPPQSRRVVEALLAYADGARLDRSELGLILPGQLAWDGLYQLHQCIAVLSGWPPQDDGADDLVTRTLHALAALQQAEDQSPDELQSAEQRLRQLAQSGGVVVRALCAHAALGEGWLATALDCSGVETEHKPGGRSKADPPGLMSQVAALPLEAWPAALAERWRALLCCQVLLAARDRIDPQLFDAWLAESYGWPKCDFYWWVLSRVKSDASLARNVTGDTAQLVTVARI